MAFTTRPKGECTSRHSRNETTSEDRQHEVVQRDVAASRLNVVMPSEAGSLSILSKPSSPPVMRCALIAMNQKICPKAMVINA